MLARPAYFPGHRLRCAIMAGVQQIWQSSSPRNGLCMGYIEASASDDGHRLLSSNHRLLFHLVLRLQVADE
eukprot:scaffold25754_cov15-Tisochrysis_lutea.AAC.1